MANATHAGKQYDPPPINGDFYGITNLLAPEERRIAKRVREFMEAEVAPIIEDYWGKDQFPHEIIPKLAALDAHIAGVGYQGYGAAGGTLVAQWLDCDGIGARRFIDCNVLGRAHWSFGRLDISLRRRGAKAAVAAVDDALGKDW